MGNDVTERLVSLRENLKVRQGVFAKTIGVPQSTYSSIERGVRPLHNRHIKLICLTFGVCEQWLRSGEGEMFVDKAQQGIKELLDIFDRLTPASRKMILDLARAMLANEQPDPA